jgi:hypothetical protein
MYLDKISRGEKILAPTDLYFYLLITSFPAYHLAFPHA